MDTLEKSNLEILVDALMPAVYKFNVDDIHKGDIDRIKTLLVELKDDYFELSEHVMDFIVDATFDKVHTKLEPDQMLGAWDRIAIAERESRTEDLYELFDLLVEVVR